MFTLCCCVGSYRLDKFSACARVLWTNSTVIRVFYVCVQTMLYSLKMALYPKVACPEEAGTWKTKTPWQVSSFRTSTASQSPTVNVL